MLLIKLVVAVFQVCQKWWAALGRAGGAHDLLAMLRRLLRWRWLGRVVRCQILRRERAEVRLMGIQRAG